MKKVLTLILALALVLSLSATAFAVDIDTDGGTTGADVYARKQIKIAATVTWGDMYFVYTQGDSNTWSLDSNTGNSNQITVANGASNCKIKATYSYAVENYELYGAKLFSSNIDSFTVGTTSIDGADDLSTAVTGASLAVSGGTETKYFMFTANPSTKHPPVARTYEGSAHVGTLTIRIDGDLS